MSTTIASHGTPTGSVFGVVGSTIGTDAGVAYLKIDSDTLNDGWGSPLTPTPTPTITPTPTPLPFPTQSFSCVSLEASSSAKCNNEFKLYWETDNVTNLSYLVSWTRPATSVDPVYVFGNNTTSSFTNNETSSFGTSIFVPPDLYNIGFTRPSSVVDSAAIKVTAFGSGKIRAASLYGYSTGTSPISLKANGIAGNYIWHSRNLSGNLFGGTAGKISGIQNSPTQVVTASLVGSPSIELLEIVGYNDNLTFVPRELKECGAPTPTPTPVPTATPTPTPTTTTTPTPTPTITRTPTPTLTPTPTPTGGPTFTPTPTVNATNTPTPTPTPSLTSTPTTTPIPTSTPTPTPMPKTIKVWLDYDVHGRAQASWIDSGGIYRSSGLLNGNPYTTPPELNGLCIFEGSLNIVYGTNYRMQYSCAASDPRSLSYQIDAVTNLNGEYSFVYVDSYGVSRTASGNFTVPNTSIYAIACGVSVTSASKGSASVSSRRC